MRIELSHHERVLLALAHRTTDRIPIAMVCSGINPPAHADLTAYLVRERGITVDQYLAPLIDIKTVAPRYVGPSLDTNEDYWGVVRQATSYGRGAYDEIVHYPLGEAANIDDVDAHRWPEANWFDFSVVPERIARINHDEPYCIMMSGGNLFESAWYMRGFERSFMDMVLQPDLFAHIMRRVTDFYMAYTRRMLQAAQGAIDLVFTADDIGGQRGLLMSLDMWQEHLVPHHVRQNALIHDLGAKVIYHTDGSVMPAVGGLIDMGIDVLQALQFDADGMDPVALKAEHGDRLCFEGGISVQKTLPFGTPDEVRQEVIERAAVLGAGGGYVLGPSHAIQADTPPENIVALFDTAATCPST